MASKARGPEPTDLPNPPEPSGHLLPRRLEERAGSPRPAAAVCALYALVLLPAGLLMHRAGHFGVETDFFVNYAPAADQIKDLVAGRGGRIPLDGYRGPLYPLVLAASGLVIPDAFTAGVAIAGLSAVGVLFFTHRVASAAFGGSAALLTIAVVGTNAVFLQYGYTAGTDMFFDLLAALAVYASVMALRPAVRPGAARWRPAAWAAAAGAFSALAYLARQNGLFLPAGFVIAALAANPGRGTWRERIRLTALFLGGFLLLVAPWVEYARRQPGGSLYSRNHLNVAKALLYQDTSWDAFRAGIARRFSSLSDVVLSDPAGCAAGLLRNVASHLVDDMTVLLPWPVGVLSALGIAAALLRRRLDRLQASFFVFALVHFTVLLLAPYRARYSLGLLAPLALLAAGSHAWWTRFGLGRLLWPRPPIVWTIVTLCALSGVQEARLYIRRDPREVFVVRDRLAAAGSRAADVAAADVVCSRKPHVAYHLKMRWARISPSDDSYEGTLRECRSQGATYLYYGRVEARDRPRIRYLLDRDHPHQGLDPVVRLDAPRTALFRILPEEPPAVPGQSAP